MGRRSQLKTNVASIYNVASPCINVPGGTLSMPDNFIGIELEFEGRNVAKLSHPMWTMKGDGSLRHGAEYITTSPLVGENVITAVNGLLSNLSEMQEVGRVIVNPSFRTSTHVHVDFSQKRDTLSNIQDFVAAYSLIEEAFYAYTDPSRRYSGYSDAWNDLGDGLHDTLRADDPQSMHAAIQSVQRYMGLNMQSLQRFGTLEFRHASLITDPAVLIGWIDLILRLKRYVYAHSSEEESVLDHIQKGNLDSFIEEVLGPDVRLTSAIDKDKAMYRLTVLDAIINRGNKRSALSIWSTTPDHSAKNPLIGRVKAEAVAAVGPKPVGREELSRLLNASPTRYRPYERPLRAVAPSDPDIGPSPDEDDTDYDDPDEPEEDREEIDNPLTSNRFDGVPEELGDAMMAGRAPPPSSWRVQLRSDAISSPPSPELDQMMRERSDALARRGQDALTPAQIESLVRGDDPFTTSTSQRNTGATVRWSASTWYTS